MGNSGSRYCVCIQELQQSGLQVEVITHSVAISACEKGQQLQQALHLFEVLQQSSHEGFRLVGRNAAEMLA